MISVLTVVLYFASFITESGLEQSLQHQRKEARLNWSGLNKQTHVIMLIPDITKQWICCLDLFIP